MLFKYSPPTSVFLSVSISLEATKMSADLYDYSLIAFPCPEKIALITSGKHRTLKELWSGRAWSERRRGGEEERGARCDSSPPLILQTQQINIRVSQAERRFTWEQRVLSPGGTRGRRGGGFLRSPPSFYSLHCTYTITAEEMPAAAASLNEITKAVNRTVYNFPNGLKPIPSLAT